MPWTIYALSDPVTGKVRYVGKTSNLRRRVWQHRHDQRATRKAAWLRDLEAAGREPVVTTLEEGPDDEDWSAVEVRWIAQYIADGADLLNGTVGGGRDRGRTAPRPSRPLAEPAVTVTGTGEELLVCLLDAQRAVVDAEASAARDRAGRDYLVRALRADDPARWTYPVLARAVGCSPELIAHIVRTAPDRRAR